MKILAVLCRALPLVPIVACAALLAAQMPARTPARDYAIRPVPFFDVTVDDAFWAPRLERNRTVSIPHIMRENERTGRVANFEKAAGLKKGDYEGRRFNDSDIYKTIEAAACTLKSRPDPALESQLAHLIDLIARAQVPDGYLYPARTLGAKPPVAGIGAERWINLNGSHELYNVGHLYEAAMIDGASGLTLYGRIIIPYLLPVIQAVAVIAIISCLKQMEIVYLSTNGAPGNTTQFIANYVYLKAFAYSQYGYGNALSVLFVVIAVALTVVTQRTMRRLPEVE